MLEQLVDIVYSPNLDHWEPTNRTALQGLFGGRYGQSAAGAVSLRAPAMKGDDSGIPYAAYIHPDNPKSGGYGGMSFVIFPAGDGTPALIGLVIGTQGLAPDDAILGRPGHARKCAAIARWLNQRAGAQIAWAKSDPTRLDLTVPLRTLPNFHPDYAKPLGKYGHVCYLLFSPTADRALTRDALGAMLDVLFEERGHEPLKPHQPDRDRIRSGWFAHILPTLSRTRVTGLLHTRRFAILQGPPGTGKTHLAGDILKQDYQGHGTSIQFHPNTTYENFIGGLVPVHGDSDLGFRFEPQHGYLMQAAAEARKSDRPYLLHIDEINRADLSKVLGEAIYLLEPGDSHREITLPHDFGAPFHRRLSLPANLHILGTMNSSDRSISIVDIAVRRRFAFLSLWPDVQVIRDHSTPPGLDAFQRLLSLFVEYASDDAFALLPGHSYFLQKDKDDARLREQLKTGLAPLLHEYLTQGYVGGFAEPVRSYLQWLENL